VQRPTTATSRRALGRMRTRAAAKSAQVITAADAAPADAAATAADTAADTADVTAESLASRRRSEQLDVSKSKACDDELGAGLHGAHRGGDGGVV